MILENSAFLLFGALTLGAAAVVVLSRNTLRSALSLGLSLVGVAGLYATMGADFLFGAQVLIYVGAIALLILFVVMLSGRASDLRLKQVNELWLAALIVCGFILWGLARCVEAYRSAAPMGPAKPTTADLGRLFTGELAVPFELVTVLLLAAMIGAVVFTRPEEPGRKPEAPEGRP
jgi:NADH-quinone oxidoreductase subunit J